MKNIAVVFFCYNRVDKINKTISSYLNCHEHQKNNIYVYIDGSKNGNNKIQNDIYKNVKKSLPQAEIIQREKNLGLKLSVFDGITHVLKKHDAAIIIEDDLDLSPYFYIYMRDSLNTYKNSSNVYQISGFKYSPGESSGSHLLPITTSWGWATWKNKWANFNIDDNKILNTKLKDKPRYNFYCSFPFGKMAKNELNNNISSWAIRWYSFVFSVKGLTLYPPINLVMNRGFDTSGTHRSNYSNELFSKHQISTKKIQTQAKKTNSINKYELLKLIFHFQRKTLSYLIKKVVC